MSFNDREISTQDGKPIGLYGLRWGNTYWWYTSADQPIERQEIVNGQAQIVTYQPVAISDNGVRQGASSQNDFQVECQQNLPIVSLFRGTPPALSIILTVRRQHQGDPDAPIYWKGLVWNVKRQGLAKAVILGRPLSATLKRTGLRLCWTKECPHFIYDEGCKVDPADFVVPVAATALTGGTVTVAATGKPSGYFNGGILEWDANADGTIERRFIEKHEGNVITIFGLTDRLTAGKQVRLYPGCNRTATDCVDKFNNGPRHGGFGFMPGASPFDAPIW